MADRRERRFLPKNIGLNIEWPKKLREYTPVYATGAVSRLESAVVNYDFGFDSVSSDVASGEPEPRGLSAQETAEDKAAKVAKQWSEMRSGRGAALAADTVTFVNGNRLEKLSRIIDEDGTYDEEKAIQEALGLYAQGIFDFVVEAGYALRTSDGKIANSTSFRINGQCEAIPEAAIKNIFHSDERVIHRGPRIPLLELYYAFQTMPLKVSSSSSEIAVEIKPEQAIGIVVNGIFYQSILDELAKKGKNKPTNERGFVERAISPHGILRT